MQPSEMDYIQKLQPLKNPYFAMRHGTSTANEEGIIMSNTEKSATHYGLSKKGYEEVRESAKNAKKDCVLNSDTVIMSSDFARARETAEIIADVLSVDMVTTTPKLRERFFGIWDGTSNNNYKNVWDDDTHNADNSTNNVENIKSVLSRTTKLIEDLENRYTGKNIVLVSHGDTLQILQTSFVGVIPSTHRSLAHLGTAEIRALNHNA